MARKSIPKSVRFEIFKRDRFTCVYCGRKAPDVLLECDHILAVANGGTDAQENLTTACEDCNRGKSAGLLEEGNAPRPDGHSVLMARAKAEAAAERLEQARAYAEAMRATEELQEEIRWMVVERWATAFGAARTEDGWQFPDGQIFPDQRSVKTILGRLEVAAVLEAVDITSARFGRASWNTCKYFYAVCWRKIRGE